MWTPAATRVYIGLYRTPDCTAGLHRLRSHRQRFAVVKGSCVLTLKRAAAFAASVLLPLSAAACSTSLTAGDKGDVVIAADLELSGAYADVGTTYQRALRLKVDQVNAAGGVQGHKLRLDVKDNRSDPSVSASNIDAFSTEPNLAAIVTGWCGRCLQNVAKTMNDKEIPTISLSPADGVVEPVSARKFIFKVGPNADDTAALLAKRVQAALAGGEKSDTATVALLGTADAGGDDALSALDTALSSVGITVTKEKFQPTDTNLTQPVEAAIGGASTNAGSDNSADAPDALIISAFSSKALLAAQTAKKAGFEGRIYFDQTAAGQLFVSGADAKYIDGIIMVSTQSMVTNDLIATNPAKIARRQWFNDYTSKYGNFSEYSVYAADAIQSIVNGITVSGSATYHTAVRNAIETGQFEGFSGTIRMSPENHSGLAPQALTLLVARGDRWQPA
jgi:branched-chain amino acid transport system substrate-binding protein